MDIIFEVLKWVLVILIAGFIGQFGKSFSLHLIAYFKKKKETGIRLAREDDATPGREILMGAKEQNAKAVKKALKAQVKAKKKASDARHANTKE